METTTPKNWKRVASAKIGRMTPDRARDVLDAINAESKATGPTIFHATIREITGGLNSQAINFYVIRRLAERAGICRK